MSATAELAVPSLPPPAVPAALHRFTAEEYEHWIELGALTPADKVELLDGYLMDKMPDGLPYARALRRLTHHFSRLAADRWVTQNQSAVRLPGPSLPEPDVALLRAPVENYDGRCPTPADIFLLVEVSETSLATDRGEKPRAYARAGVPEYWIVNLPERVVEVHREPESEATRYGAVHLVPAGGSIAPAAFPDVLLAVGELLG